jgi:hypothetical protein
MTTTIVTYTPREAAVALAGLARRAHYRPGSPHGGRARYEPNLTPPGPDPWPVSDHGIIRVEAWAVDTSDESLEILADTLAGLPGAMEQILNRESDPAKPRDRRPYVVTLLPGDGSYCSHTRERWTRV